jgi:hypothetical protein
MASIHHYLSETQEVWEQFRFSPTEDIAVSEIWRSDERRSDATVTIHRKVSKQHLPGWLYQTSENHQWIDINIKRKCLFRVVWVLRDTKQRLNHVDAVLFEEVSVAFRHQLAQNYYKTQYAGIGSTIDEKTGEEIFFLCNHPKLAITWSQGVETGVTSMICVADKYKLDTLQELVGSKFIQDLAHVKMTPALMSAVLSSKEIDIETGGVKKQVREVEVRTGYHEWTGRCDDSAAGDLVGLSAKMSGCGIRTESNIRKLGVITEFSHFVCENSKSEKNGESINKLLSLNRIIERRTAMQTLDLKYSLYRIQTQKEAVSSSKPNETTLKERVTH